MFFSWLTEGGFKINLIISDEILAAFLVDKLSEANSDSLIISISAAIKWLHSLINAKPNPVDSPIVQQIKIKR